MSSVLSEEQYSSFVYNFVRLVMLLWIQEYNKGVITETSLFCRPNVAMLHNKITVQMGSNYGNKYIYIYSLKQGDSPSL